MHFCRQIHKCTKIWCWGVFWCIYYHFQSNRSLTAHFGTSICLTFISYSSRLWVHKMHLAECPCISCELFDLSHPCPMISLTQVHCSCLVINNFKLSNPRNLRETAQNMCLTLLLINCKTKLQILDNSVSCNNSFRLHHFAAIFVPVSIS